MNHKKRINFSPQEKLILWQLVTKHLYILGNKKCDNISSTAKKRKWEELAEQFNKNPECTKRNADQLKKCWKNHKRLRQNELTAEEREVMATGGGYFPSTSNANEDLDMDSLQALDIEVKEEVDMDPLTFVQSEENFLVPSTKNKTNKQSQLEERMKQLQNKKVREDEIHLLKTQELNWRVKAAEMIYKKAEVEYEKAVQEKEIHLKNLQEERVFLREKYSIDLKKLKKDMY